MECSTKYALSDQRVAHMTELKAHEAPSGLQDTIRLLHNLVDVGAISNSKRNRVGIKRAVLEGKVLRISFDKVNGIPYFYFFYFFFSQQFIDDESRLAHKGKNKEW
jgi:hypothetical protein